MIEKIRRLPYNYKKKAGKLLLKKEKRYEKENGKQNADDRTCFSMTAGMLAGCGNSAPAAVTDNASADTEALAETSETAAVQETAKTDNGKSLL